MVTVFSVMICFYWNLFFNDFNHWNGIGNGNGLLHGDSFRYFDNFWSNILLSHQTTKIHKLLTRFFQIGVVSIHNEIELWFASFLMNAIDLLLNKLLLLLIKILKLSLQLLSLMIETFEVEGGWTRLEVLVEMW